MYRIEVLDEVSVGIFEDDKLIHEVGCLDGEHEVTLIKTLADGICQQMNNLPDGPNVGKALWAFLHALDGEFTLGEIVVLMERVSSNLGSINSKR